MTISFALAKENIYISSDRLVVAKHTNFICKKMTWQSSLGLLSLLMRAITVVMFLFFCPMSYPQSCHIRLRKRDKSHTGNQTFACVHGVSFFFYCHTSALLPPIPTTGWRGIIIKKERQDSQVTWSTEVPPHVVFETVNSGGAVTWKPGGGGSVFFFWH